MATEIRTLNKFIIRAGADFANSNSLVLFFFSFSGKIWYRKETIVRVPFFKVGFCMLF